MEDVTGKKILDFSGRIVHNVICLIEGSQKMCCKTHMNGIKSGENDGWRKTRPDSGPAA
jgi:hypothetical protein